MLKAFKAVFVSLLFVAYPFLSRYLASKGFISLELIFFSSLMLWRGMCATEKAWRFGFLSLSLLLMIAAYFANAYVVWLMPSLIYLGLTFLFGYTLFSPPSLCERLVRLLFPEFKAGIAEYLHGLTWLWTLFFALNVVICAVLPVLFDAEVWAFYTGFLVYFFMGGLFIGEWLYRHWRFPDLYIPPVMDTVKFFVRNGHKVFKP